jgi:fimbrial chaperone protein
LVVEISPMKHSPATFGFRRSLTETSLTSAYLFVLSPLFVSLSSGTVHAQALSVSPVNVIVNPGQKIVSLTIKNTGTADTSIQSRTFKWSQNGEEDPLEPTTAFQLSPPITTVAAGETQVLRIALREAPRSSEDTYRLLIDQLPPPGKAGTVQVMLRLSIPIFVEADVRTKAKVALSVEHEKSGKFFFVATNSGQRHESIRDVVLTTSDGTKFKISSGALPYILSGTRRRWVISPESALTNVPSEMKLTARTDGGLIEQQVSVNEVP